MTVKAPTKREIFASLVASTGLSRKQVAAVLNDLTGLIA